MDFTLELLPDDEAGMKPRSRKGAGFPYSSSSGAKGIAAFPRLSQCPAILLVLQFQPHSYRLKWLRASPIRLDVKHRHRSGFHKS